MVRLFGNSTTASPAAWHPEPDFRGTWSILSTCLITMFLCVWTAVHLNLPEHKKEWQQKWRHLGWLFLALLAPEVAAWTAFEQWRKVKSTTQMMQDIYRERHGIPQRKQVSWASRLEQHFTWIQAPVAQEPSDLPDEPWVEWPDLSDEDKVASYWTDVHSWYALMGGLVFDTRSAERPFLPNNLERVTLGLSGLKKVAVHWPHVLPPLLREEILARSKQDGLLKLITCWQAIWFCVQCIVRLSQGLSITLLELNVFGHAVCALVTYLIWFDKPKDVGEPTLMTGVEANAVAALLTNMTKLGQLTVVPRHESSSDDQRSLQAGNYWWEPMSSKILPEDVKFVPLFITSPRVNHDASEGPKVRCTNPAICLATESSYWALHTDSSSGAVNIILNACDVERLKAISPIQASLEAAVGPEDWRSFRDSELVVLRPSDSVPDPDSFSLFSRGSIGYMVAASAYGGLHVLAYNSPFPSLVEQILWRASSVSMTLYGIAATLCFGPLTQFAGRWKVEFDADENILLDANLGFKLALMFLTVLPVSRIFQLWYLFCRAFLVVESFIMLAHISDADLQLPVWSQYVPHVT